MRDHSYCHYLSLEFDMTKKTKDKSKREEERRKAERFAWLGPLLERRKTKVEPIEDEDDGKELEEIEK